MAGLSITGQMKVSTLQEGFLKEFGLTLRVYDGREFADPSQTLAQVRKKKGSGKDLSVAKNMKVGNLEDKFEVEFGLKVQVAGSDDSYLCKNELTLNAAQQEDEKKLARKERKAARQAEASDGGDGEGRSQPQNKGKNLLTQESYKIRVLETTFQADVDVKLLADADWEFNSNVCDNPSTFQIYFMDTYGVADDAEEDSYTSLLACSYKENESNEWKLIIFGCDVEEFLDDMSDYRDFSLEGFQDELRLLNQRKDENVHIKDASEIWNKVSLFSIDREDLYDELDEDYFDECPREEGNDYYNCHYEISGMEEGNVFLVENTDAYFNSDSIGGISIKTILEKMFSINNYESKTLDLLEYPLLGKVLDREWPFDRIFLSDSSYATKRFDEDLDDLNLKDVDVHSQRFLRDEAARNLKTPAPVLEKLAADKIHAVRWLIAENPNTPASVLEKLSADDSNTTRVAVSKNPNTPASLREKLVEDLNADKTQELAADDNTNVRRKIAVNPNTPVPILEKLAADDDENVRWLIARNANTPVPVLEKLAADKSFEVRWLIAKNTNTPASALEKLAADEDDNVRAGVARNPSTPVPV